MHSESTRSMGRAIDREMIRGARSNRELRIRTELCRFAVDWWSKAGRNVVAGWAAECHGLLDISVRVLGHEVPMRPHSAQCETPLGLSGAQSGQLNAYPHGRLNYVVWRELIP